MTKIEMASDGTRVDVHEALGRVVVATRAFEPGDIVMADVPLVLFPVFDSLHGRDGNEAYLQASKKTTAESQAAAPIVRPV